MRKCCDCSLLERLKKTIALLKMFFFFHFNNSKVSKSINMEFPWYTVNQTIKRDKLFRDKRKCCFVPRKKSLLPICLHFL